jgi:serine/threonine-protein kinase HipA
MSHAESTILVYADWQELKLPQLMGVLRANRIRGKEIFDFEYSPEWLQQRNITLDSDLQLYTGRQYLNESKSNFGLFTDSSPDRWGRVLMKRREAAIARQEERRPQQLLEVDFLLGVHDSNRMGAYGSNVRPKVIFWTIMIPWQHRQSLNFVSSNTQVSP